MRRLRTDFGLQPVEYPTTRRLHSAPWDRAADLMAAFADPGIAGVLATIGGDDQLTVLPFLDPDLVAANPKPFAGYSDNTNLLNWLWNQGLAGWHGGSTMVHLGRGGGLHPISATSLRAALFDGGDLDLAPAPAFSEDEQDWADPATRAEFPLEQAGPGWIWHQPDQVITAPTWGGNLEILHWNLAASRWIRPPGDYAGCVLLLETSEERPSAEEVFRMLRNFGERGLLAQFPALVVARPKAALFGDPADLAQRQRYRDDQREAVLRALGHYHPAAMAVFNVDFGHTDPQYVLPYGGSLTVDGPGRRITAHY
jgi:muramoyltetrapeptide carboxypeptidase LdcA involved in peptidoglycan recycling